MKQQYKFRYGYCGRILNNQYSNALKKRVEGYILRLQEEILISQQVRGRKSKLRADVVKRGKDAVYSLNGFKKKGTKLEW